MAELPGRGALLVWRTRSQRLCFTTARPSHGGGTVFGPCVGSCDDICLRSSGAGHSLTSIEFLLAGTVRRDATALRITRSRGAPTEYPLRGPLVPGTSRRIFMLWLGRNDWRRLELLRGGSVVAEQRMPAAMAASSDCQEHASTQSQFVRCLKRIPGARFP